MEPGQARAEGAAMGAPLRSRLGIDERRAQLLELGLRLFGTRAYDEVSIDDIAAAANVSKGLLYHYFGSKRAFYVETVRFAAARLIEAVNAPSPELPPPARALAGLDAYLRFVEERGEAYAALVTGGLGADPEVAAVVEDTRRTIVAHMMADIGLEEERPVFSVALRGYIGAVEAIALEWLARRDVPRPVVLALLASTLHGAVVNAARLDPDAGVDPAQLGEPLPLVRATEPSGG